MVLDETKYIFLEPSQDNYITNLINSLAQIDKAKIHQFCQSIDGTNGLVRAYRKAIEVFTSFMNIYPNVLPAETYMSFKNKDNDNKCIATCSLSDIKTFYQDAYESLLSLLYIPVCLDNIVIRSDFQQFDSRYDDVNHGRGTRNINDYLKLDNGTRINKLDTSEYFQGVIAIPANRSLRNGIGHNNINYDGISQIITAYDLKQPGRITSRLTLMEMAIDCIGLTRSAVIISEIILFMMRDEFRLDNISTLIHPHLYKKAEPNMKCPCGSNLKYKKCCRNAYNSLECSTGN